MAIADAKEQSQAPEFLRDFEHLGSEQAPRASFFVKMADVIADLGLSNPHEKSALSIEPTHPVHSSRLGESIDMLGVSSSLGRQYKESKLSLVSLAMIEGYSPKSEASQMRAGPYRAPLYLLDPLYGFVFLFDGRRMRNHCLAIDLWTSHLSSMPRRLAAELWKNRADNMLSGGAFAGRLLFEDIVPIEKDSLRRSQAPEIIISSEKELLNLVDKLRSSASKRFKVEMWFRGQKKDYLTPDRLDLARRGITPYSNIRESDFTPSLYRNYDNIVESPECFEAMVMELAEWVHCAKSILPGEDHKGTIKLADGVAKPTGRGITAYQRGLLLQQYGSPSAYVDITKDPLIAAWFAIHTCKFGEHGMMIYGDHSWSGSDQTAWPTIFIFPLVSGLHPFVDLESVLPDTVALRPSRQRCGLLGGAGNLARNYCARYLGLKIRLAPSFRLSSPLSAFELFPPDTEDRALKLLKNAGLADPRRRFVLSEHAVS